MQKPLSNNGFFFVVPFKRGADVAQKSVVAHGVHRVDVLFPNGFVTVRVATILVVLLRNLAHSFNALVGVGVMFLRHS